MQADVGDCWWWGRERWVEIEGGELEGGGEDDGVVDVVFRRRCN